MNDMLVRSGLRDGRKYIGNVTGRRQLIEQKGGLRVTQFTQASKQFDLVRSGPDGRTDVNASAGSGPNGRTDRKTALFATVPRNTPCMVENKNNACVHERCAFATSRVPHFAVLVEIYVLIGIVSQRHRLTK